MEYEVRVAFLARLDDELKRESEALADNRASDFADYRLRVGRIRGLKRAKELLAESVRAVLEEDEDETDGSPSGQLE